MWEIHVAETSQERKRREVLAYVPYGKHPSAASTNDIIHESLVDKIQFK